jgi:putative flippase GtrA
MAFIPLRISKPKISKSFRRFLVVGAIGFAINASVLALLLHFTDLPFYSAQIIGVEAALLSNFLFHDRWTFQSAEPAQLSRQKRVFLFHVTSFLGAGVNSVVTISVHHFTHLPSIIDLACGSACALLLNYLLSLRLIWRRQT